MRVNRLLGRDTRWLVGALISGIVVFAPDCEAAVVNTGNATSSGFGAPSITHGLTINSGDVVVAFIAVNNNGDTITDNNGANAFTEAIQEDSPAFGGSLRYAIHSRVAGASEPPSYGWTLAFSSQWALTVRVFAGVDTASVWDVAPSVSTRTGSPADGTTATAPSMTTLTAGAMGIAAFFTDATGITYSAPTNGYGTLVQENATRSMATVVRTWATAGVTGTTSATLSALNDWTAHQFALKATARRVFYSVGTNTADLKNGAPTLTLAGGVATLTVAQPDHIGVGDEITYNGATRGFISGRVSSTVYSITDRLGVAPPDIGPGIAVNSIMRAFNTLDDATLNSGDGTHLGTSDLVANGLQLNWPCYADGPDPSSYVRIEEPWITGPENYIRAYTPTDPTEVGVSQRHQGVAGTGYRIAPTGAATNAFYNFILISTDFGYVRIEGLEIDGSSITDGENLRGLMANDTSPGGTSEDVRFTHNLIHDITNSTIDDSDNSRVIGIFLDDTDNSKVANNIVYNLTSVSASAQGQARGLEGDDAGKTHHVYNNTFYNIRATATASLATGILDTGGSTIFARNNYVGLVDNTVGGEECFSGTFAAENNNVSSDLTAGGASSRTGQSNYAAYFLSVVSGLEDLHILGDSIALWGSDGADLDSDPNLPVTDDIDGEARDATAPDIGADEYASPMVFYSVGISTADLGTGSPTITISGGLATLSAAQTNDVGVGDVIDYDSPSKLAYISAVASPTQFRVLAATGALPVDVPGPGVGVNSIKRAFNSIASAAASSLLPAYLGTGDLVTADRRLTWVCYDDGPLNVVSTTDITGYTTDAAHFITLSVAGASQVATGNSQRHNGIAGTGTRMEVTSGTVADALDVDVPFTRIEWLEIDGNDNTTVGGILLQGTADNALLRNLIIHNVTSDGVNVDVGANDAEIRNIIVYDYGLDGVHVSGSNATIANSTFYLGRTSPASNGVQTDTGASATASLYNVLAVGPETDFFENTAGGLSLYNCISTDASASTYDVSGSFKTGVQPETEFVSLVGTLNLHLRAGAEAIDFGTDLSTTFSDDIDGNPRPQGAAWDVGADESFFSGATTNYRSIGTVADLVNQGTITVTAGSTTVTKTGGVGWLAQNRGRGDVLIVNGADQYMILRVVSDDVLTLASLPTTGYVGTTYMIARQFTTLTAWEDCIDGQGGSPPPAAPCFYFPAPTSSLVADGRIEVGIAYEDSVFTAALDISGATTDQSHVITLTADGGNRHYGVAGNGVVLDLGATNVTAINIRDDYVNIEWFELKGGGGPSSHGIQFSGLGATNKRGTVRNNLIHDMPADGIRLADPDSGLDIYNNIVYETRYGVRLIANINPGFQVRILNNTVYSCNGTGGPSGIAATTAQSSPLVLLQNNIAHSNNNGDFNVSLLNVASSNNLASDATGMAHSPAGGGLDVVPLSGIGGVNFVDDEVIITPGMDLHLQSNSVAIEQGADNSALFMTDIDTGIRPSGAFWDMGADEFGATTAVELVSFEAMPLDSAADLQWRTGSELDNLGFHLYRSMSEDGPWTRITPSLIPGLGSSPEGASYSFRDTGLQNGTPYFYRLEDIDASSVSTFHGPVSATPSASASPEESDDDDPGDDPDAVDDDPGSGTQAYGSPGEPSFRVVSRTRRSIVLELTTPGFVAEETPTGVRVSVPGFDSRRRRRAPALPLKRALLDGVVGRHARIVWAKEKRVLSFPGLTPAAVGGAEILVRRDGTVRPRRRGRSLKKTRARNGVLPGSAVRIAGDAFIGETKKLALEMSPIRYDTRSGVLLLARTLRVKVAFDRKARTEETGHGSRGRRRPRSARRAQRESGVLAHLHTLRTGLHAVSFEALSLSGPIPLDTLRLSLLGEAVPFHVRPRSSDFGPGSVLFFHAASVPSSMDFSSETTYALERAPGGVRMGRVSARSKGLAKVSSAPLAEKRFETNRFYQPGLLDAPDIWLWDFMVGGMSKSVPFSIEGLDSTSSQPAQIQVVFQGASEAESESENEHHLSVSLNGTPLGETSFDGKLPHVFSTSFSASLLLEGENSLTLTNLGDTGAYSFVFLDRVDLVHPQTLALRSGRFEGLFSEGGKALVLGKASYGVDVTDPGAPRWLRSLKGRKGKVRFKAEAGHRYALASPGGLLSPRVSKPVKTKLRSQENQADYVVIAPQAFLSAARPLLERRQDQGLTTRALSFEQITSEFGYGRPSAQAIRDFLAHAFHNWQTPSVKYVLLLGDASSDPRNFTGRDKGAPLPAFWAKTSYLWTSSDPTLAAVNGEDGLPDLAIGRLPATTLEEALALVQKVLEWEDTAQSLSGKVVLVADNPDIAGDFEADIADIRASVLGGRETKSLLLRQLGASTRSEILASLDQGASILSYVGHGGPAVWASENVLNSWDPPSLLAQSEQPLMLTFNCLNGYFVAPNYDSLAEAFMKAEGRGTIGAFSPSGLSLDGPAHRFHKALMAEIVSGGHERLGDAVLAAQAIYAETGLMPELLAVYHLFGDPAMRIR